MSLFLVLAIVGFNVLVVIHELGHLLVARWCGMTVRRFSIGFGPPIVSLQRGDTIYQMGLLPIGGFVQIKGLGQRDPDEDEGGSFMSRPLWQRALMVAAGPAANYLFAAGAFIFLIGSFNLLANPTPTIREVVGPAAAAGLRPHDTIVEIDGAAVESFRDILVATGSSEGRTLQITVVRPPAGARPPMTEVRSDKIREGMTVLTPTPDPAWPRVQVAVTPEPTGKGYRIGVSPEGERTGSSSTWQILRLGVVSPLFVTQEMLRALGRMISGEQKAEFASVVKITEIGADTFKRGLSQGVQFLALLSVNLFLLNLLPLPALDGGRLLFLGIEAVARRPVPPRLENAVHGVGMLFLLGFIVILVGKDIASYF